MNPRGLRRYIDDLLRGRRPKPFRPDDFEAAQIRTAIDLQASRLGSDAPRQEFLTDLRRRLAAQQDGVAATHAEVGCDPQERHRRHVGRRGGRGGGGVDRSSTDRQCAGCRRRQQRLRGAHPEHRTLDAGRRQRRACPTGPCGPSISARSSASCAVSTASPKPCQGCAPTRAAGCGSTRPTTGCAALVIRHLSRPPARC